MERKEMFCKEVDVRPFAYAISLVDGKWKMHIFHSSASQCRAFLTERLFLPACSACIS